MVSVSAKMLENQVTDMNANNRDRIIITHKLINKYTIKHISN